MGPLCKRHHHDIHDRGWIITLDPDRNLTITLPDGTTWAHHQYRPPGREPPGREPPGPPSDEPTRQHGIHRPDSSPADETRDADPPAPDDRPDAAAA
jgi:hypothetical protein